MSHRYYNLEKRISLLRMVEVRWKRDNVVQYTFQDYIIKGCIFQDVIHASSIIQRVVRTIDERHDGVKHIILKLGNVTWFASQNFVPFICNLNTEPRENNEATIIS